MVLKEDALRSFVEGTVDGLEQQDQVNQIIQKILQKKIRTCRIALRESEDDGLANLLARKLWISEQEIAQCALDNMGGHLH
jgi:hypothetical protein